MFFLRFLIGIAHDNSVKGVEVKESKANSIVKWLENVQLTHISKVQVFLEGQKNIEPSSNHFDNTYVFFMSLQWVIRYQNCY